MIADQEQILKIRRVLDHVAKSHQDHVPENTLDLVAGNVLNQEAGRNALDLVAGNVHAGESGFDLHIAIDRDPDRDVDGVRALNYGDEIILDPAGALIDEGLDRAIEGTQDPVDEKDLDHEDVSDHDHVDEDGLVLAVENGVAQKTVNALVRVIGAVVPHLKTRSARGRETVSVRAQRNGRVPVTLDLHVDEGRGLAAEKRDIQGGGVLVLVVENVLVRGREAGPKTRETAANQRVGLNPAIK